MAILKIHYAHMNNTGTMFSFHLPAFNNNAMDGCTYGTAKKKRPGYLVGNLVATNWPIEKALHAIGYNQIPTK